MYIAEMIHERELAIEKSERHDLLSNLLEANDHDADLVALTNSELICKFTSTYKSTFFNKTHIDQWMPYSEYKYIPSCWT